MEETTKLQSALAETERLWREEKRKAEYYRKLATERWETLVETERLLRQEKRLAECYRELAAERWEKLQEVKVDSCRD